MKTISYGRFPKVISALMTAYIGNVVFALLYFWASPLIFSGGEGARSFSETFLNAVSGNYLLFPESFGLSVPLTVIVLGMLFILFDSETPTKRRLWSYLKVGIAALIASILAVTFSTDFSAANQYPSLLIASLVSTAITAPLMFAIYESLRRLFGYNGMATGVEDEYESERKSHRKKIILTLYLGHVAFGFMAGRAVPWDSSAGFPNYYSAFYFIGFVLAIFGLTVFVQLPAVHLLFIGVTITTVWLYKSTALRRIGITISTLLAIGVSLLMNALMRPPGMLEKAVNYLIQPVEGSVALVLAGIVMILASDWFFRATKSSEPAHT